MIIVIFNCDFHLIELSDNIESWIYHVISSTFINLYFLLYLDAFIDLILLCKQMLFETIDLTLTEHINLIVRY